MRLIRLNEEYKKEWEEFVSEFENNGEKLIPYAMKGNAKNFEEFLVTSNNDSKGIGLGEGKVSSDIYFLVKEDTKKLLGAISIRHTLNDYLFMYGGHIGYGVRPSERKRGYGSEMLKLALEKCKELEIDRALVTCYKWNVASSSTIKSCGGVLDNEVLNEGELMERYWINV
ncbi:MAG: GNAT family N-acetyltransferase [Clostridium sp.]